MTRVLPLVLLLGCTTENTLVIEGEDAHPLEVPAACLEVEPAALWFGAVEVGREGPRAELVTVTSTCEGDLELRDLDLTDAQAPFRAELLDDPLVLPGERATVRVTFDPDTHYEGPARLRMRTSAGVAWVELHGEGVAPVVDVEPQLELEWTPTGCPQTEMLALANAGSDTLEVTGLELSSTSEEFALAGAHLPLALEPGEQTFLPLGYLPVDAVGDMAWLRIHSNDPLAPQTPVTITGRGTAEELFTEAHEVPLRPSVDVLWTLDRSG